MNDPRAASHFVELVRTRHSVRDFKPDALAPEVLDAILDDARYAPSWSNTRPYLLAVASGEQAERLRAAYVKAWEGVAELRSKDKLVAAKAAAKAVLARQLPDADFRTWRPYPAELLPGSQRVGKSLYEKLGIQRGDKAGRTAWERRNLEFFGAPTLVLVYVHGGLMPFAAHDAGLMLQTLMLSAAARGVGSCPLGVLATWRHPGDAEFDIPKPYKLITGLALGYESDAPVNEFRAEHPAVRLAEPRRGA